MWRLASRPGVRVVEAGLACCSLEVEAAVGMGLLVPGDGSDGSSEGRAVTSILIVAGTITSALEPAIRALRDELAEQGPVRVLAFGACATSGGPYWDAPTVANGLAGIEVASYVPGCPPRPQALIAELERMVDAMLVGTSVSES